MNHEKHITLDDTRTLEEEQFFLRVAESLAPTTARDAFVFVHGYKCPLKMRQGELGNLRSICTSSARRSVQLAIERKSQLTLKMRRTSDGQRRISSAFSSSSRNKAVPREFISLGTAWGTVLFAKR
jgi:hypothetical protein